MAKRLALLYRVSAAYLLGLQDEIGDVRLERIQDAYQRADERGKESILRIAEVEAAQSYRTAERAPEKEEEKKTSRKNARDNGLPGARQPVSK